MTTACARPTPPPPRLSLRESAARFPCGRRGPRGAGGGGRLRWTGKSPTKKPPAIFWQGAVLSSQSPQGHSPVVKSKYCKYRLRAWLYRLLVMGTWAPPVMMNA